MLVNDTLNGGEVLVERGGKGRAFVGTFGSVNEQGLSGHVFSFSHLGGGIFTRVSSSSELGLDLSHGG